MKTHEHVDGHHKDNRQFSQLCKRTLKQTRKKGKERVKERIKMQSQPTKN